MALTPEFWEGKRILLTGHTGFKGSWLTALLHSMGAQVFGYGLNLNPTNKLYLDANISNLTANEVFEDIRELSSLRNYMDKVKPEFVIHFAAQSLVRKSYDEPIDTITTNVIGTSNLLISALGTDSVKLILNVTTDKVYRNDGLGTAFKESDELGGDDVYSASKAAVEIVSHSIRKSLNPKNTILVNARAGNVIGGGDWGEDRLIPDIVRAVRDSRSLSVRNPDSTRPWQYVLDCLHGYLQIFQMYMENPSIDLAESFNFGPLESLCVREVLDIFSEKLGLKYEIEEVSVSHAEKKYLSLNSDMARQKLRWSPLLSPQEAIVRTSAWYEAYLSGVSARSLVMEEIDWFLGRVN